MALLFGSHFLPYAWFYRSRGYALLALLATILPTIAVLVARDPLTAEVPLISATAYAVAVAVLAGESRGKLRQVVG